MANYVLFHPRSVKIYKNRVNTDILNDHDYKALYRFDKINVQWLADHFLEKSDERRGGALAPKQKMEIFLRYVGDPGFQSGVGNDSGCDQTTACKIIHEVRRKITRKSETWIKFPTNNEKRNKAKDKWSEKFQIPTVIGAIDCSHIKIQKPKLNGDEYINRKGFASLNVQATCDGSEKFTSVSAEWPGSVHDSRILRNSTLPTLMNGIRDSVLLGDSGYGLTEWLLTPYKNPTTPTQIHFNHIYTKERVIIERCFGQLKRRFPILHYKVRTSLETIPSMIIACFILHNCAKYLNDEENFEELDLENGNEEENNEFIDEIPRQRQLGKEKRDQIAHIIYQNR